MLRPDGVEAERLGEGSDADRLEVGAWEDLARRTRRRRSAMRPARTCRRIATAGRMVMIAAAKIAAVCVDGEDRNQQPEARACKHVDDAAPRASVRMLPLIGHLEQEDCERERA